MDEYTKIASLLREGKISPDEAEKLLDALDEFESGRPQVVRSGLLRARLDRADLLVRVDPAINEPEVEAPAALNLELQKDGDGWSLKQKGGKVRVGLFDLFGKRHSVGLTLPAGVGLELRLGQGALRVADPLPALRAKIGQGSADFATVEEVDLQLGQGSISGRARLSGGSHQLGAGMGSVRLILEEGSDLRLQLKTGMGEISVTGSLQYTSPKPTAKFEGVVGEGRGSLKVSVGMGNLEVEVL